MENLATSVVTELRVLDEEFINEFASELLSDAAESYAKVWAKDPDRVRQGPPLDGEIREIAMEDLDATLAEFKERVIAVLANRQLDIHVDMSIEVNLL